MKIALSILICLWISGLLAAEPALQKHGGRPLQAEATMESLEPWETPLTGFFIRSHHGVPRVDGEHWALRLDGLVDRPVTLSLKDIQKLPSHTLHAVFECSGNWRGMQRPQVPGVQWGKGAVGNAEWTGVRLSDLLKRAGVKSTAKFVRVEGADQPALAKTPAFVRTVPLAKMLENDTLLAWQMNRQPMPVLHGGPLRLILPRWYGQNWIKWVTHLTLTDAEDKGFYMAKGYRMPKEPLKPGEKWDSATGVPIEQLRVQSILVSPVAGQTVGFGQLSVRGKAFSGFGTISKVEISTDGGGSWKLAELDPARPSGGWQAFVANLSVEKTGALTLVSRATDSAGNTQPLQAEWNPPGYLRNAVDRVEIVAVKTAPLAEDGLLQERCLTCHNRDLIASQRLSPEAWEKLVTKMEGFGAKLEGDEKTRLVTYLSRWSPELPVEPGSLTSYWAEEGLLSSDSFPRGTASRGKPLFAKNCAVCHAKTGDGDSAPRLVGRDIPHGLFWAVVGGGKGDMPAFGEALKRQQIADIEAFVRGRSVAVPAKL